MEKICPMDCHSCTLQEGVENKSLCSTLLIPAMIKRLSRQISDLSCIEKLPLKINEVQLITHANEDDCTETER